MKRAAVKRTKKPPSTLAPVHPNVGDQVAYRIALEKLIAKMQDSVLYWLKMAYKANEPRIAQDEIPAAVLRRVIRRLGRRWQKNFDTAAEELAAYFTQAANQRSSAQLQRILRKAGFSVKFQMTAQMRDVMAASVNEQVSLIKSIPQKYFTDIEGSVMRSVAAGRDLKTLTDDLAKNYSVTRRRAAFIARDQNNKMTATLTRTRQIQMGVMEAIWVHSHGGKEPRPTHVKAGAEKQRYDVTKGWFDPDAEGKGKGKWIFPGELPNCRCVSRPVLPGFN